VKSWPEPVVTHQQQVLAPAAQGIAASPQQSRPLPPSAFPRRAEGWALQNCTESKGK